LNCDLNVKKLRWSTSAAVILIYAPQVGVPTVPLASVGALKMHISIQAKFPRQHPEILNTVDLYSTITLLLK
jgi:hypothetical protein